MISTTMLSEHVCADAQQKILIEQTHASTPQEIHGKISSPFNLSKQTLTRAHCKTAVNMSSTAKFVDHACAHVQQELQIKKTLCPELVDQVRGFIEVYMSKFDGSHDYTHIERVVSIAHAIYAELAATSPHLDRNLITLCALLHDVGDRKYLQPGEDCETMVLNLLLSFGADLELAEKCQAICGGVSYSSELKDGEKVKVLVAKYPELAVVQDADRLDAIGAGTYSFPHVTSIDNN